MNDSRILVDECDRHLLEQHKWTVRPGSSAKTFYAQRNDQRGGRQMHVLLHRVIMEAPSGIEVDHKNGNGLDCRRENLRLATSTQNKGNLGLRATNTSGYKGVQWRSRLGKWSAKVKFQGEQIYLGVHVTPEEAARAYDAKALELFGEFARTNAMMGLLHDDGATSVEALVAHFAAGGG